MKEINELVNVQNTIENRQQYLNEMYTDYGIQSITGLLKTYIDIYLKETEYPQKIGMIFDVPYFDFHVYIKSKDDVLSRIKVLMTLLSLQHIELDNGQVFTLEMK